VLPSARAAKRLVGTPARPMPPAAWSSRARAATILMRARPPRADHRRRGDHPPVRRHQPPGCGRATVRLRRHRYDRPFNNGSRRPQPGSPPRYRGDRCAGDGARAARL